ncbi:MAG TPA: LLM class flavin-dependent oxidoreductase [Roseiflexaceae bacterium]|nr:LLM class flavin-dependent oxidoreductase [Roseiflexaceae bacterium]
MIAISIDIESQFGLNWSQWKNIVAEVEALGFAGLYRSDHFTVYPQPPDDEALELVVSLAYLADHTQRVHFGPLVAPFSFRDPVMLARQAAALDDLSGGRFIFGVGAGWGEREHAMFGYPLGDIPTRMDRLAEGLEVITRLLRSDEPVSYEGRFFQLHEARLLPRPQRQGGPPLLIPASGSKRGLPLVARYADIWNTVWRSPEEFRERSNALTKELHLLGRPPSAVKRTMMTLLLYGSTPAHLERQTRAIRRFLPHLANTPLGAVLETLRTEWNAIIGTPEQIIERINAYEAAGVEELILEWFDTDNLDGLRAFAAEVLPHLSA